ncbi:MAG: DMT family transporter [Sphingobacteriales bacterium]|nr:MAG: DMT family transporter [Sphingobacteriales bacterium]
MLYLILTIALNVVLFVLFKLFSKYSIDSLQAIVFNYLTCVVTGSMLLGKFPVSAASPSQPWFWWAVAMGAMFISLFNLIGRRTREDGITTTTIANKLSLVIPVIFSVWLYHEEMNAMKIAGILLALPAVYFTAHVKGEDAKPKSILWPALLFVGSGLLDTLVKYVEQSYLATNEAQTAYTVHVFLSAFIIGFILLVVLKLMGRPEFAFRNIVAGVILGVPNYFSIYFFIKFLHSGFLDSSAAIPVNNIGIVLLSTVVAILFFKEKETPQRIFGLVLSIIAILLIAFADIHAGSN